MCLPVIASECNDLTDREHCVKALKVSSKGFLWLVIGAQGAGSDQIMSFASSAVALLLHGHIFMLSDH